MHGVIIDYLGLSHLRLFEVYILGEYDVQLKPARSVLIFQSLTALACLQSCHCV